MSNCILPRSKFIHIPKCGGTAVVSVLWNIGLIKDHKQVISEPHYGHLFASQMPVDERINFTFVRNPITWWHSWYAWNKSQPLSRFNGAELSTKSFNEWARDYGQMWFGMYTRIIDRYMGLDPDFPSKTVVTKTGRVENLFNDLENILIECGEVFSVDKLRNAVKDKSGDIKFNRQKYDRAAVADDVVDCIYRTEKSVFKKFGYGTNAT